MLQEIHTLSVEADNVLVERIGKYILQNVSNNTNDEMINESLSTLGLIEKNKTVIINYLKDLKK